MTMILQVADWECLADSGGLGPDWSLVSLVYPYVKPLALFLIPVKNTLIDCGSVSCFYTYIDWPIFWDGLLTDTLLSIWSLAPCSKHARTTTHRWQQWRTQHKDLLTRTRCFRSWMILRVRKRALMGYNCYNPNAGGTDSIPTQVPTNQYKLLR